MSLADVRCTAHGVAEVATLTGEVDISNTESIRRAITRAVPNRSLVLILDLTEVDFFDSAGIQLIYQLREDLRARGQVLQLVIPSISATNDALRLAGVKHQVEILETVEDALRRPLTSDSHNTPAGP
jgi:anti-sigma B factor antagonist